MDDRHYRLAELCVELSVLTALGYVTKPKPSREGSATGWA